jgi:tetratricopeptide (TPR) repeat protein
MEATIEKNNQGVQSFLNRNFEQAEKFYKEALDLEEENTTTLNNLGLLYHQLEEYETAVEYYEKAILLKPKEVYYVNLGNSLMFLGRQQEAIQLYEETIKMNPNHLNAKVCLAKAYESEKRFQEAEAIWENVVVQSEEEQFKIALAKNYMIQGAFEKGLAVLIYLPSSEKESEISNLIGVCEFNLKNYGLAEKAFKKSLSLEPNDAEVRHYLAINYLSKGDALSALKELSFLIKVFPEDLHIKLNITMVLLSMKKYVQADELLNEVLAIDSENEKALHYKKIIETLL